MAPWPCVSYAAAGRCLLHAALASQPQAAAKVVFHARGLVFCGYRPDGASLDFPGGKALAGEDALACAERELEEEVGGAVQGLAYAPRARCEMTELGYLVDVFAVALPESRGVLLTREGRRELRAPGWRPLDTVLLNLARTRPGLSGHAYAAAVRACVPGRADS